MVVAASFMQRGNSHDMHPTQKSKWTAFKGLPEERSLLVIFIILLQSGNYLFGPQQGCDIFPHMWPYLGRRTHYGSDINRSKGLQQWCEKILRWERLWNKSCRIMQKHLCTVGSLFFFGQYSIMGRLTLFFFCQRSSYSFLFYSFFFGQTFLFYSCTFTLLYSLGQLCVFFIMDRFFFFWSCGSLSCWGAAISVLRWE